MVNLESLLELVVTRVRYGIVLVKSGWFVAWDIRRRAGSLQESGLQQQGIRRRHSPTPVTGAQQSYRWQMLVP